MASTENPVTYTLQPCDKSFCNKCMAKLILLCPDQPESYANWVSSLNKHWSMFYICFTCRIVYQIGVGKLEVETNVG